MASLPRLFILLAVCGLHWPITLLAQGDHADSREDHWRKSGAVAEDLAQLLGKPNDYPEERRSYLLLLSETAYKKNRYQPLWHEPASFDWQPIYSWLSSHGFSTQSLVTSLTVDQEALRLSEEIAPADLLSTLHLAEIAMLVKRGPISMHQHWQHWEYGDSPGEGNTREQISSLRATFAEMIRQPSASMTEELEARFAPQNWVYRSLLRHLPERARSNALREIEFPPVLRVGDSFAGAKSLAEYLVSQGHLSEPVSDAIGGRYESTLEEGIKAFQKASGTKPDGIIGPQTVALLRGETAEVDSKKLKINLHRARWLPNDLGRRYLLANIPSGEIYAMGEHDTLERRMRIVFGAPSEDRQTPFFRDEMRTVIFCPYWMLPNTIAVNEYLPSIRRDMGYLGRNGYKIVDYLGRIYDNTKEHLDMVENAELYLRQEGGSTNALGRVKFLFPNPHYIYFHDTPEKQFFDRDWRAYSHGCVRLQKPAEMANWVLNGQGKWNSKEINKAIWGNKKTEVSLYRTIPVYITYFTLLPEPTRRTSIGWHTDYYELDMEANR